MRPTTPLLVLAAVLALQACSGDTTATPAQSPTEPVAAVRSPPANAGERVDFRYVARDSLTVPDEAQVFVFDDDQGPTEAQVAGLAGELGIEGTPVRSADFGGDVWLVGDPDDPEPSLVVEAVSPGYWYYTPAADNVPLLDLPVWCERDEWFEATEPQPAECEPLPAGQGLLSEREAVGRVKAVLSAAGHNTDDFDVEAVVDDRFTSVRAAPPGLPDMLSWVFGFGDDGVLVGAAGVLAAPIDAGTYPLVSISEALERLEDETFERHVGVNIPDPTGQWVDPIGEPVDVELHDVRMDVWSVRDSDDRFWVVPAYRFTDTQARSHTVVAVADSSFSWTD